MPTRALALLPLTLLVSAAGASAADGDPVPPGGIADFMTARTLGMAAGIGVAAGNEGIYVNPAAMAARRRYALEGMVLFDRRGADNVDRFYGASVVDSQTSALTAGVSYLRDQGLAYSGNAFHLALAGNLAESFHLGVTGKLFSLQGATSYQAANVDAGAFWQVTELLSLGFAGYNLVGSGSNKAVTPMGAGAGFAIGTDRSFQLTGDWRADFDRGGKTTNRFAAGAEGLLASLVVLRAGFTRDETLTTNWWSVGVGLVNPSAALDVGYRQSTTDTSAREIAATLKLFVNP